MEGGGKRRSPISILGVPIDYVTRGQALEILKEWLLERKPRYVIPVNVEVILIAQEDPELLRILVDADLVLGEGKAIVWASKILGNPLPEEISIGSLLFGLLNLAERENWKVFLLGKHSEFLRRASVNLRNRFERLTIIGVYGTETEQLHQMNHEEIIMRIRATKPDILLVSFPSPIQEKWIRMYVQRIKIPVTLAIGRLLEVFANKPTKFKSLESARSGWIGELFGGEGLTWKPRWQALLRFWRLVRKQRANASRLPGEQIKVQPPSIVKNFAGLILVEAPQVLDTALVEQIGAQWESFLNDAQTGMVLDLHRTRTIDSTGVGLLVRLHRCARALNKIFILLQPAVEVLRLLRTMHLENVFVIVSSEQEAEQYVREHGIGGVPVLSRTESSNLIRLEGEVTAAHVDSLWEEIRRTLKQQPKGSLIRLDLSGVTFIDSSGLNLLIRTRRLCWDLGITLVFQNPSPIALKVLEQSGLREFLFGGMESIPARET